MVNEIQGAETPMMWKRCLERDITNISQSIQKAYQNWSLQLRNYLFS